MVSNFEEENNSRKAIIFMVLTALFFAIVAAIVKSLSEIPLMVITFFRYLPSVILIPVIFFLNNQRMLANNKKIMLLRSVFGFLAMLGTFYTYTKMNLADAMTIAKLSPFFVVLLSTLILKENLDLKQVILLIMVIIGTLFIIKPGFNTSPIFPIFIGIVSAFLLASGHLTLRILRLTDNPYAIIFYFSIISLLISLIFIIVHKDYLITLNALVIFKLLSIGILSFFSQYFLTMSYRLAKANLVSLYLYLQIVFGGFFGILFFHEIPDILSSIGILIVIFCGILNFQFQ